MFDGFKIMTEQTILPVSQILFVRCSTCGKFLVWEHYKLIVGFTSSCCEFVYDCIPVDNDGKFFCVFRLEKNMDNVISIRKK